MRAILAVAMGVVLCVNVMGAVKPAGDTHARETGKDPELSAEELKAKLKNVKVDFAWSDAALGDVLKDLAKKTGVKIAAGANVNAATVTLKVTKMNADLALDWVAKLSGTTVSYKDGAVTLE